MYERRHDLIAVAALVLLPALLFPDVLLGWSDFFLRDYSRYYHPAKTIVREIVLGGEFPYWNRFFSAGQPLAANPEHEVFYPPNWLILLPDYQAGFRILVLGHLSLAFGTMFALLRSMRLTRTAAVFGALSFGLGGVVLSYLSLLPYLFSVAWLPLSCLFTRAYLLDGRPRDFALASLSLAMQLLIGEPTTALQTGILLGAYALTRTTRLASVRRVGLISLAAFVAAAAQTLPTLDLFRDSIRIRGFDFADVSRFSFAPLPSLVIAFGKHTPLLEILYDTGIARSTRFPEKFVLMGVFAMVVFAAKVLDLLLAGDERIRRMAVRITIAIAAFAAVVALVSLTDLYAALFTALWKPAKRFDDIIAISGRDWLVAAGRAILLFLLVLRAATMKRAQWIAVAAVFLVLDLGLLVPEIAPRIDASFYRDPPKASARLPLGADFRLFHAADWYKDDAAARPYLPPSRDAYWVLRNGMFPVIPAAYGIQTVFERDYDGTALLATADFVDAMAELAPRRPDWSIAAMAMGNARFRADFRPFATAYAEAGGDVRAIDPLQFTELANVPRYRFAERLVQVRDARDLVERLSRGAFDHGAAFIREAPFVPARGVVRGWSETANTLGSTSTAPAARS